jgi:hypothetical protein
MARLLKLTADDASAPVNGIEAASLAQTVQDIAERSAVWYGLALAADAADDDIVAAADIIEAQSVSRIFGVTLQDTRVIDSSIDDDLASRLQAKNLARTLSQYSTHNAYAVVSAMARAFTVDFTAQNTVITLKFKTEPSVTPEGLNESQAQTLIEKHCNVFVKYNNDTAIIQQGVMANGDFFDERHGLDWFQNYLQTNLFNLLYTSQTKIPQTDAGVNMLLTNVEASSDQAVTNGLLAPGVWRSTVEFGSLKHGDTLTKGYYAYALPVSNQAQAEREARKAPTIQLAAKLAGAIHYADVIVNVNR